MIFRKEPYSKYFQEVNKGNAGNAFTEKTLAHLEVLNKRKNDVKSKRNAFKTSMSRGSGLI